MSHDGSPARGHLIIVSGPSGVGKSTIISRALAERPEWIYSVSFTTRPPRGSERDGEDYHFVSKETFQEKIKKGEFAEWAEVHGDFYGTFAPLIEKGLVQGRNVVVDVDTQGARRLLLRYEDALSIFISPPTMAALRDRLTGRETDSPEAVERRLRNAREEMAQRDRYTHVLVNDDLEAAISRFLFLVDRIGSDG
jgi:guanylate kinase